MERILFGDNQFFGVNHMSEDKARAQAMRFRDAESILGVLDEAYAAGVKVFMCTTHDRISDIVKAVRANPAKYADFQFYPCMPYAHKYANSVGEVGILDTVRRFAPGGLMETMIKGAIAGLTQDAGRVMRMLVDAEMAMFKGVKAPIVFVQNVVTDLLLGLGMHELLRQFRDHVRDKYQAEAGFITMNLPMAVDVLEKQGIENPIVCANINKIGFRMCGGLPAYESVLRSGRCRAIAMSVFASGAIPPREAIDWVCGLTGVQSIVFGASSGSNIRQTKQLIDKAWTRST